MNLVKSISASVLALGVISGVALVTTTMHTPSAYAQSSQSGAIIDQAKRDGIVGERADGYLGLVTGSAAQTVIDAMNEVNIGRKAVYTRLARQENVSIEVVAALTGEKQIAKAAPGSKIMGADGRWVTK